MTSLPMKVDWNIQRHRGTSLFAIDEVRDLRRLCWAEVYATGDSLEDGFDECAWHWTAYMADLMVASARLTIHSNLIDVPDAHLFSQFSSVTLSGAVGYISRLVVHPVARGCGLADTLDKLRIEMALNLGCELMVVVWNPLSGLRRKQQLMRLGFLSADGEKPHPDGGFGVSFIYQMELQKNTNGSVVSHV